MLAALEKGVRETITWQTWNCSAFKRPGNLRANLHNGVNHWLESRIRENRASGSEGGEPVESRRSYPLSLPVNPCSAETDYTTSDLK